MTDVTEEDIDAFLNEVLFVVAKSDREDYIRPLIKTNSALGTTDKDLRRIFAEIRKLQVGIKSNSKVEGVEIVYPSDVYKFNRVMRRSDIELLIISRLLKQNPLKAGVPVPFISIYQSLEDDEADLRIEDCQHALARQMFAVAEAPAFWALLGEVVAIIHNDSNANVEEIYHAIDAQTLESCHYLDALSHQYFIAIVKEGLGNG